MFIAMLFTIAKTWKQPKCPSTNEWIKKMWYIYTIEYYSAIKNNEIMPFVATWMDLEIIILREISQRKMSIIQYHLYGNRLTDLENKLMVTKGIQGKEDKLGIWD